LRTNAQTDMERLYEFSHLSRRATAYFLPGKTFTEEMNLLLWARL
jgi:hypothetical protein